MTLKMPTQTSFLRTRWIGLLAGPILALYVYFQIPAEIIGLDGVPLTIGVAGKITGALVVWMSIWWLTEAIPIYATALLPLVVFPLTGTSTIADTTVGYAHPIIFLLLGGSILALALERWNLHSRFAAFVIRLVGTGPRGLVGGVMVATAIMSMWISNTATSLVMLPIALDIIRKKKRAAVPYVRNFSLCLLLGVAYSASIGGLGTIVGASPNAFVVSFIADELGEDISFAKWSSISMPIVIVFLPVLWLLLTRVLFPLPSHDDQSEDRVDVYQERWCAGSVMTLIVFFAVAASWMARPLLTKWTLLSNLSDSTIAIAGALLLFAIPTNIRKSRFLMDWETAVRLPWGILLLLGGGISLAGAISSNGVSELIAGQIGGLADMHPIAMTFSIVAIMIFLTELTSNTATTAALIPVFSSLAIGYGIDPEKVLIPATMAAGCAFMLPVATPPNAVVFGSGLVSIPEMVKAGFWINIVGLFLLTLIGYALSS